MHGRVMFGAWVARGWGVLALGALLAKGTVARAEADGGARVAAWPLQLQGVNEERAYAVQVSFRRELEGLLGPRLVAAEDVENAARMPEGTASAACLPSVRCAVTLGRLSRAQVLLHGVLRAEGTELALDLVSVAVPEEREAGRVTVMLPEDISLRGSALRETVARLVMPEKHKGTLVVNGWTEGLELVLDGEPRPEFKPEGSVVRAPVRVGRHTVEVKRGSTVVLAESLDVRFEDILVLMAPPPGKVAPRADNTPPPDPNAVPVREVEKAVRVPVWAGPVVMALSVPPVLLGVLALAELTHIGPLALMDTGRCSRPLADQDGTAGLNRSYNTLESCGSLWHLAARKDPAAAPMVALNVVIIGVTLMLSTAALAVGAALLVVALLPPTLE